MNKKTKIIFILSIFLGIFALVKNSQAAAPNISEITGSFFDNSPVIITGLNFGSGPSNVEWLGGKTGHIESGSAGSVFSKTNWDRANDPTPSHVVYSATQAHSGTRSILCNPTSGSTDWQDTISYHLNTPVNPTDVIFISRWYYMVYNPTNPTDGQWKILRLSNENTVIDGTEQLAFSNWINGNVYHIIDPVGVNQKTLWQNYSPISFRGQWIRVDETIQASSENSANGYIATSIYRPEAVKLSETSSNVQTHWNGYVWNYIIFQNYALGNGNAESASIFMDDIYISNGSQARIELGDANTYSACQHLEIQPSIEWDVAVNPNAIKVTLNQGSFNNNEEVYFYIIDSDGHVSDQNLETEGSQGYPIIFGSGSSDTTSPSSPSGLSVN